MSIAVKEFYNYLKFEKAYSELTVKAYLQDLKILFLFEKDITKVDNEKVQTLVMQQNSQGKSASSIRRLISSIKIYLQFLYKIKKLEKQVGINVITPKLIKNLPKTLSYEQILLLINNLNSNNEERDIAIIALLYSCALRVSELVNLDIENIDSKEKFIKVLGKGNRERFSPIGIKALELLSSYILNRSSGAIFVNTRNTRISTRSVQNIIKNRAKKAGIEFIVTPHMLRHAAASHLLQSSEDLRATQKYLGHKSITSTQVYTHLDFQSLAKVYDKYHPKGDSK